MSFKGYFKPPSIHLSQKIIKCDTITNNYVENEFHMIFRTTENFAYVKMVHHARLETQAIFSCQMKGFWVTFVSKHCQEYICVSATVRLVAGSHSYIPLTSWNGIYIYKKRSILKIELNVKWYFGNDVFSVLDCWIIIILFLKKNINLPCSTLRNVATVVVI